MEIEGFNKIGKFGVDSGRVLIVDPCYVLDGEGRYPLSFGHDWEEFVEMNIDGAPTKQLHGEMGVLSTTGYGDGVYEVYARIENQRVMELRIIFDE
jgi:hypothetical protein